MNFLGERACASRWGRRYRGRSKDGAVGNVKADACAADPWHVLVLSVLLGMVAIATK